MLQYRSERVELFKMLFERNELCRQSWNAYQRYSYYYKSDRKRTNDSQLRELLALRANVNSQFTDVLTLQLIDDAITVRKKQVGFKDMNETDKIKRLLDHTNARTKVCEFTERTHTRRIQLMHLLKTKQKKNAVNVIESIMVQGKRYTRTDMKEEIRSYDTDQAIEEIFLG